MPKPWALGLPPGLGVAPGPWGCPGGRGVAPGAKGSPLGRRGCPKGRERPPILGAQLFTYGSVWAMDWCILHGFSFPDFDMLDPRTNFWSPDPTSWPRKAWVLLGTPKRDPKNIFLWRDWSPTRFPKIFCEGNGFYGTQEPSGCTNFPQNHPRGRFYKDFTQT